MLRRSLMVVLWPSLAIAAAVSWLAAPPRRPATEAEPQLVAEPLEEDPRPAPRLPPPGAVEVREALKRAFDDAVLPASAPPLGRHVGDFNGDGSEDLAVVVRPDAGHLAELSHDLANWTLQDVRAADDGCGPRAGPLVPPRVDRQDLLLAVIHGRGTQGWRSPEARQCYLLANAEPDRLRPRRFDARRHSSGGNRFEGDVLVALTAPSSGFLRWTGARYSWRSLRPPAATAPPLREVARQ
jgi:hypothetical protein